MKTRWLGLIVGAFALAFGSAALAGPDEDAIAHMMKAAFDKPESRLTVSPTVVVGDYAIAGWSQGEMGGRALLKRGHGAWSIVLCAGDQIRSATALQHAGLSSDGANRLAASLALAEKDVPADRLAMFAKFDGIVMLDGGAHPRH